NERPGAPAMTDEHDDRRDEADEGTSGTTDAEEGAPSGEAVPEAGQESNPGEVQTYERAREVREEPDATEGVPGGAGGPAEQPGDRIPPAQAGDESERGEPIGSAIGEKTQSFDQAHEATGEAVTEPDE